MTAIEYCIITACLLLAFFLIWKEVKRPNKTRLIWRIIASAMAVTSLILLGIPVHFNTTESSTKNKAVLLTDGYNKDSLIAFFKQHKNIAAYTKDTYLQQDETYNLHVFGYGLSTSEWQLLPASNITFHPSVISDGITAIGYNRQINSGSVFTIQGTFKNTSNKKIKLALSGFGAGLDSVVINPAQTQKFVLTTMPKFIGKAVYDITAISNKDTVEQEQLPVEVFAAKPLKILMLAAWPDFENKFLQNWLSQNNYVVAARTTISKNKYSYAFFDTSKFALDNITPNLLQQFDVLIADGAELSSLSKHELFNIKNQINDNGLGLIIKADSTEKPAIFYNENCTVVPSSSHNKQNLIIQLPGNDTISLLAVENASFLKTNNDAQTLIADNKNNVLACNALYGNGSMVFSTFNNSYYWMLSGNKKSYELLWAALIKKAAKKQHVDKQWSVQPELPAVNQPVQLKASTVSNKPFQSITGNSKIAFAAQPFLPFEWSGIYIPLNTGWQTVAANNSSAFSFYVFDKNDWKNIAALQKINDTYVYASTNKKLLYEKGEKIKTSKKTIPMVYFFVVFLCCCIFLWIEKKLA